jgi:signal transduction histidine kinase
MDLFKDEIPVRAKVFISLVTLTGAFVLVYCLFEAFTANPLSWLLLAAITAAGSFVPIGIPYTRGNKGQSIKITVSDVFILVSILLYSPEVAVCVALCDAVLGSVKMKTFYRIAFNLCLLSLVAFTIGHLFYGIQGQRPPLSAESIHDMPLLFLNLGLCAFLYFVLNTGFLSLAISLATGNRLLETWKQHFLWAWVTNLAAALAAAVIFLNYEQMRFLAIGIAIPVVIVMYHTYRMNQQRMLTLQESQRFQSTLDALTSNIALLDDSGKIITVNAAWRQFAAAHHLFGSSFGIGVDYLASLQTPTSLKVQESAVLASGVREVLDKQRDEFYLECFHPGLEEKRWSAIRVTRFTGNGPGRVVVAREDITARKRAEEALRQSEEHLRQSQKMEAVGVLAGGIAHDFRNLLMVILAHSDLISGETPDGDMLHDAADEITRAANSAAALTSQLLTFSRKELVQPRLLDLNTVLSGIEKMLQHLVGVDVGLITILKSELWRVKVDRGQFEQVIVNLVVNSRDAMPAGGKLTIETDNVELDQTFEQAGPGFKPGPYAMVAVSDTGCGMDQATLSCAFEPFFTTKEVGKGTGLGLSTVYGIINQSGGQIAVNSEPGSGTVFKLYLPRYVDAAESLGEGRKHRLAAHGSETSVPLEDEVRVRRIA